MSASRKHSLSLILIAGAVVSLSVAGAQDAGVKQNAQPATVRLNVIVTNHANHSVNEVNKDNIQIFEDNLPQTITEFSKDKRHVDYGLVIDTTGSVRPFFSQVLGLAKALIDRNNPEDQTFIERFVNSDKIETVQEFTNNRIALEDGLDSLYIESGQTALIDAVYVAILHVAQQKSDPNRRRALVLITDGDDRASYYKLKQLVELIHATDVQIFSIGLVDRDSDSETEYKGKLLLGILARESGGRAFFPANVKELNESVGEIGHDLREQFVIGYQPSVNNSLENFRNVTVQVSATGAGEGMRAIAKSGYLVNPPALESFDLTKKKKKKKTK